MARTLMDQPHVHEPIIHVLQNKLRGMELGSQLGPQSRQIHPSIQTRSIKLKVYSHPHFDP